MIEIDAAWQAANPLPPADQGGDKDGRGRVLVVGGSAQVPGAIRLTGEAALRVGAGKLKLATIASAALPVGVAFPEAAVLALPEQDGEIGDAGALADPAGQADALVVGPGMVAKDAAVRLVEALARIDAPETVLLLDAAAVACAGALDDLLRCWHGRLVMTPHCGEMASLLDRDAGAIKRDLAGAAATAATRFGAVVALKDKETHVASPAGDLLHYPGGGPGLGTGGSGDVLAGVIGGLIARGEAPLVAAGWGVWLHGEAGRTVAGTVGTIGFLARELLPALPPLLPPD